MRLSGGILRLHLDGQSSVANATAGLERHSRTHIHLATVVLIGGAGDVLPADGPQISLAVGELVKTFSAPAVIRTLSVAAYVAAKSTNVSASPSVPGPAADR